MSLNINNNFNRAQEFDKWTNNEENMNNPKKAEDFKMFDFNPSQYSSDVKAFAQEYIDLFDGDKDGNLSKSEFINMAIGNFEIPEEYKQEFESLFDSAFEDLNMNKDDAVDAGEYASMLMVSDTDFDALKAADYNLVEAIDGKLSYDTYARQGDSSDDNYESYLYYQNAFYEQFYKE